MTEHDVPAPEFLCSFCRAEVGAFELFDGRLCGYSCIASALREAQTQLIESFFDSHSADTDALVWGDDLGGTA